MTDNFLQIDVNESSFPWVQGRSNKNTKPKYKIVSRSMSKTYNSIVMLHKAGDKYVKNYYMAELIQNDEIISQMDENDINLLKWVIESEIIDPLDDIKKGKQAVE